MLFPKLYPPEPELKPRLDFGPVNYKEFESFNA